MYGTFGSMVWHENYTVEYTDGKGIYEQNFECSYEEFLEEVEVIREHHTILHTTR